MNNFCEIFRTGTHTDSKGQQFIVTEDTLDSICKNFKESNPDVPICIGHPEQTAPAYGWVNSVKRIGKKLYCDFKQVQESFKDAVRQGLFKTRSISINPKTLQLRHIAFLGAQAPAIKGMEEFCFKDNENNEFIEFQYKNERENMTDNLQSNFSEQLAQKDSRILELENKLKKIEEKMLEQTQSNFSEQLEQKDSKISELENEIKEIKENALKQEFSELVDKWIGNGNILPKHREQVMNVLQACNDFGDFQFSEAKESKSALDSIKEFFDSLKVMDFSDNTNEKYLDKKQASDFSEYDVEQWEQAITEEIHNAAIKGVELSSREALKRLTSK